MSVLDVGCGTGTHLDLYRKAKCEVYGIDASPAMLNEARNKLGVEANLHMGDAADMPYPDGSFDLVIAMLTLHEMSAATQSAVLSEVSRVLKQGGSLLIIDYHSGPLRFPKGWLFKMLIVLIELGAGLSHFRNYRQFLANGGAPALGHRYGLEIEKSKVVTGGNLGLYLLIAT